MLAQEYRLRKKGDIEFVWKHGRSFVTPIFSLKYCKNKLSHARATVVVGTKVSKRAVVRNLVKRRLREALRPLMPSIKGPFDILISVRPGSDKKTYAELSSTLLFALKKTGLLA